MIYYLQLYCRRDYPDLPAVAIEPAAVGDQVGELGRHVLHKLALRHGSRSAVGIGRVSPSQPSGLA